MSADKWAETVARIFEARQAPAIPPPWAERCHVIFAANLLRHDPATVRRWRDNGLDYLAEQVARRDGAPSIG